MSPDFLALDENLEISYDQIDPYGISETPFPINQSEWSMVATNFFFDMGTEFLAPASKSLVAILPRVYFRSQWTGMLWCYFEQYQLTFSEHKFASCETYVYSRSQYPLIDSQALVSLVRYIGLYFRAQHLKPINLLGVLIYPVIGTYARHLYSLLHELIAGCGVGLYRFLGFNPSWFIS